jgi:hypothetical protein
MKRFVTAISLSTFLAIGMTSCAHQQLTKRHAVEGAATAAVIAGMIILAANANCGNCNIGIDNPAQSALPPQR